MTIGFEGKVAIVTGVGSGSRTAVENRSPEAIAEHWTEVSDMSKALMTESAFEQSKWHVAIAVESRLLVGGLAK